MTPERIVSMDCPHCAPPLREGERWGFCEECIRVYIARVIAEEREACARLAETWQREPLKWSGALFFMDHSCDYEECCAQTALDKLAVVIRARGAS